MKVLKLSKLMGVTIDQTILREISALTLLRGHPNIVELKDVIYDKDGKTVLIFEFMQSDLLKLLRGLSETSFCLAPYFAKQLAYQILQGISHAHRNQIMHRDLKPSNILVNNSGLIKITDFGMCRKFSLDEKQSYTQHPTGTLWYRAPEMLLDAKTYSPAVDMWAYGCILFEMTNGH